MEKLFVLDSTVFIEGQTAFISDKACVTVFEVAEEMKEGRAAIEFEKALRMGLEVIEPEVKHVKVVEGAAKETNDKVSRADTRVVALSLQFREKGKNVAVVSDDYGVQNLCRRFKIEVVPLSKKGIRQEFKWIKKCRGCGKVVESNDDVCPICGSPFKFVPKAKGKS